MDNCADQEREILVLQKEDKHSCRPTQKQEITDKSFNVKAILKQMSLCMEMNCTAVNNVNAATGSIIAVNRDVV